MSDPSLFRAAYDGDMKELTALLSDPNTDIDFRNETGSTALIAAAYNGHVDIARVLLENGARMDLVNEHGKTALDYARMKDYSDVVRLLKNPPPLKQQGPGQVIFFSRISDRTLEEVFNFVTLERISMIRNGRSGPVEAFTRDSFESVEESVLRKAFAEHVRRGGTVPESKVFPRHLPKNKLPRG